MNGKEVVNVRIPLPRRTYAIAAERASKAGCATGTKLRMDMILYYDNLAAREARRLERKARAAEAAGAGAEGGAE